VVQGPGSAQYDARWHLWWQSSTATSALRQYLLVHTSQRIDLQMVVNFYHHRLAFDALL
jgi:hypothetical protein